MKEGAQVVKVGVCKTSPAWSCTNENMLDTEDDVGGREEFKLTSPLVTHLMLYSIRYSFSLFSFHLQRSPACATTTMGMECVRTLSERLV